MLNLNFRTNVEKLVKEIMFEEPMITEKRKKHIKILINSTEI